MSHWCKTHPKFSAISPPNSLCGDCWTLYYLRNPERKHDGIRIMREEQDDRLRRINKRDKSLL